jgi:hypothetical protein
MIVNGKEVDRNSLEIDGVDTGDYPDFVDTYFSYAEFIDGTVLSDLELDELSTEFMDVAQEMAYEYLYA